MPFTLSHAAAALPFRRTRLVLSALVVGTFAPDIEYFIRMRPGGGYGHTIPGAFLMSLPLGLITLWLFHRFVKRPAVLLMPPGLESRIDPYAGEFRFFPWARFAAICVAMLIGIATHILWDSFTHHHGWTYNHWMFLHQPLHLPFGRRSNVYKFLQFASSAVGLAILLGWFLHWYRVCPPDSRHRGGSLSRGRRWGIIALLAAIGLAGGYARARFALHRHSIADLAIDAMVTFFAVVWWELVAWGVVLRLRGGAAIRAADEQREEQTCDSARR